MKSLILNFCGEHIEIAPDTEYSFGRSGDLAIDENKFLHRVMGVFVCRNDWWWLHNVGAHLALQLQGQMSSSTIALSPGGSVPLVMGPTLVRFAAGGTSYELEVETNAGLAAEALDKVRALSGDTTIDAGSTPLSADQLLLLIALSEPRLRRGPSADVPPNAELMERFGWSVTKFNRKLDSICVKFSRRGVGGLVGTPQKLAQGRRSTLVDYVIAAGMVTVEQLALLPPRQGSAPARQAKPRSVPSSKR
jgi:hypothetical protein